MQSAEKKKTVMGTVIVQKDFVAETRSVKTVIIEDVEETRTVRRVSVAMEIFAILAEAVMDNVVVFPLVPLEVVVTV